MLSKFKRMVSGTIVFSYVSLINNGSADTVTTLATDYVASESGYYTIKVRQRDIKQTGFTDKCAYA